VSADRGLAATRAVARIAVVKDALRLRRIVALIALLLVAGTVRALLVCLHDPLYAYANSYDETRYTSCFDLYPDRPAAVPPQQNSPEAPYAKFRFIASANPMCYASSELAFSGITALIWKGAEWLGAGTVHDVRAVAVLRWLALLAMSIALSRAWLRRGEARAAVANAALVPFVFADPGNTLYLATFYAEWTALLAAYLVIGLALVWRDAPLARWRFVLLALAAFALATSKLQHMLLPLALAAVVLLLDRARLGRTGWRAVALALGALLGAYFQVVQSTREGQMMDTIRQYNRADVVFTALLPFSDDPRALLEEAGIDPGCAIYSGRPAWQIPDLPERTCRGLVDFTRTKELGLLLRHPILAARLATHGIRALDPWIATNIGVVEGGRFEHLAPGVPSVGRLLHESGAARLMLLGLPLLALAVLLARPGVRTGSGALDATALVVVVMAATFAVTLLGDGLADTAKQGHLVVNAALAWWVCGLIMLVPTRPPTRMAAPVDSISTSQPRYPG
jgi:hypothetical protein